MPSIASPYLWHAYSAYACILTASASCSVNAVDVSGTTALMLAAVTGRLELMRLLLTHGALANAADHFGTSSLWLAAEAGQLDMVKVCPVGAEST